MHERKYETLRTLEHTWTETSTKTKERQTESQKKRIIVESNIRIKKTLKCVW